MYNTYSPKEFGKLIGRTTNTLQKWDREGKLTAHRSPTTNRRYYTHEQYLHYRGLVAQEQGLTIVYSRVSGVAQKPDLANQLNALEVYCKQLESRLMCGCLISAVASITSANSSTD